MELIETSTLSINRLRTFSLVTGALVATFGFVVLVNSLLRVTPLTQIHTNSALVFLLSGVSLVLLTRDRMWVRPVVVLSVLVTILGFLTIVEFWFNTDLFIDDLFGSIQTLDSPDEHSGRFSPAVAGKISTKSFP